MLIVTAENVVPGECLTHPDGTADYIVWAGINRHCIWRGPVNGHVRKAGAASLLRLIADRMEENDEHKNSKF